MNKDKLTGLASIIGILALSFAVYFYSVNSKNEFQEIIEKQLELIKNHKFTEAYYAHTSKEFQAATSLEDFKKFVKSFPILDQSYTQKWEVMQDEEDTKTLKGILKDDNENTINAYFQFIPQDDEWKILNMKLIPSLPDQNEKEASAKRELMKPIDEQLELLDADNIESAYTFSSEDFKKNSKLSDFKEFLKHFPIFTSFIEYEFLESNGNDEQAIVKVKLLNDNLKSIVDYSLVKENGHWRILGMQIEKQENLPSSIPDFDENEIRKPIEKQLMRLQGDQIEQAYNDTTSEAFKKSTSFEVFKKFIETYPIFKTNKGLSFLKLTFNNNIGTYLVALKSLDGKDEQVEYSLIKENGTWKILQIQFLES